MKSKMILTIGLLAIVLGVATTGIAIQSVQASPEAQAATGGGNGASVLSGFPCGIGPGGSTTQSHEVLTPSGQENEQCHGDTGPVTNGGGATVVKGAPCTSGPAQPGVTTTQMQASVTPSGHVNLNCHS